MQSLVLNNELTLPCPDGFYVMDEEEIKTLAFIASGPGVCLKDPDRHIVVSAGYKKAGGLTARLLNQKDVATKSEGSIRDAMRAYGYLREGAGKREIGGLPADGFQYSYTAEETDMYGETYVLKKGKTFYYFHAYMRNAHKKGGQMVLDEILNGVVWG